MGNSVEELLNTPFLTRTDEDKLNVVKEGRPRPALPNLLTKHKDKKSEYTRHFSISQYEIVEWLTGCEKVSRLFCWPCLLFSGKIGVWNNQGFFDLKHLSSAQQKHGKSNLHMQADFDLKMFEKQRIDTLIDNQQDIEVCRHNEQQQCPAPMISDVGQPVTVSDTDQVVTALGSNDDVQNSILPFDATEVCVFDVSKGVRSFSEVDQLITADELMSQVSQSKRSSRVIRKRWRWSTESAVSSVGDQELGLVTDGDSMAPNSKVAKSDANVGPHAVLQEAIVFPQSTIAATQKEKRTLAVANHQVAVMSNLLSMWKDRQLCDSYISNGSTDIMVHKMVLGAVCPKVLPILHSISSSSFPKVTLSSSISKEGLLAFAEYMYTGVLDLNQDILVQLQTIAQRLDMKYFELLCINELHKAKAASILSSVPEPILAESCSLSSLLPSFTHKTTDTEPSPNTILSPLLRLLESINSRNSSNSQGFVPTGNLATVGGSSSSSSFPTLKSVPATNTADQVIPTKIESESDETVLTPDSQRLKTEPHSPVSDQHGIQEELLKDFDNIVQTLGLGYS